MSREFQSEFLSYVQRTAQSGEEKSDSKGEKAHPEVTRPEDSKINLRSKEADSDYRRGRGTLKDETVCISRERRSRSNDTITVKNKRGKSRRSASPVMSSPSGSKESPVSPVETLLANRPKRIIIPKALESTAGLSRIEEKELNKALYASLQETRSPDSRSQSPNPVESHTFQEFKNATIDSRFISHSPARNIESSEMPGVPRKSLSRHCKSETTPVKLSPSRDNSDPLHMKDDPVRHGYSTPKDKMKTEAGKSGNESDGAAKKSYFRSPLIHAQRKFAQGSSRPCSPSTTPRSLTPRNLTPSTTPQKAMATPGNVSNSSINTSSKLINTADFLTFLCLRGTDALPKHLDFTDMIFNNESVVDTPPPSRKSSGHKRRSRQGSPATSKSSSDIGDLSDLGVKPLSVRSGSGHSSPARKSKRGRSPKMPDLIPVTPPKTIRKSSNPPDLQPVYPMDVEKSSSSSASKSPPKSPRMAKTVQKLKEKLKRVKMHREREKLKKLKLKEKTVSQKRKHLIEECFASDSDQEIIFKKRKKHRISESQSRGKDKRSRSPTKSGLMKSQKLSKSLSSDTDESKSLQSRENSPSKQKKLLQLDIVKAKSKLKLKKIPKNHKIF
ncbi:unnamed protein product [Owenia fusiformis]|uniref:Uncharacterized protein n=1 Tax=Owenia fusiformis TaxID=6347 RepID=A0A8S4NGR7_OWEFU|nr:unnamed protein product [Owenia fusiformis]